jgi:cell division protein FtsL
MAKYVNNLSEQTIPCMRRQKSRDLRKQTKTCHINISKCYIASVKTFIPSLVLSFNIIFLDMKKYTTEYDLLEVLHHISVLLTTKQYSVVA